MAAASGTVAHAVWLSREAEADVRRQEREVASQQREELQAEFDQRLSDSVASSMAALRSEMERAAALDQRCLREEARRKTASEVGNPPVSLLVLPRELSRQPAKRHKLIVCPAL